MNAHCSLDEFRIEPQKAFCIKARSALHIQDRVCSSARAMLRPSHGRVTAVLENGWLLVPKFNLFGRSLRRIDGVLSWQDALDSGEVEIEQRGPDGVWRSVTDMERIDANR